MKRKTKLALGLGAALALGAAALPALSHGTGGGDRDGWFGRGGMMGDHGGYAERRGGEGRGGMMGGGGYGPMTGQGMMSPGMMQMMMQMHGGAGMGQMGGFGMGPMGGPGMGSMGLLADTADADGDGIVTPDELKAALAAKLAEFDADGDGTLSLAEFEALHAALTREITVDRFQALDADGDGKVTGAEIAAPAERMQKIMQLRDRFDRHDEDTPRKGDGPRGQGPRGGMMGGNGGMMGNDNN